MASGDQSVTFHTRNIGILSRYYQVNHNYLFSCQRQWQVYSIYNSLLTQYIHVFIFKLLTPSSNSTFYHENLLKKRKCLFVRISSSILSFQLKTSDTSTLVYHRINSNTTTDHIVISFAWPVTDHCICLNYLRLSFSCKISWTTRQIMQLFLLNINIKESKNSSCLLIWVVFGKWRPFSFTNSKSCKERGNQWYTFLKSLHGFDIITLRSLVSPLHTLYTLLWEFGTELLID